MKAILCVSHPRGHFVKFLFSRTELIELEGTMFSFPNLAITVLAAICTVAIWKKKMLS